MGGETAVDLERKLARVKAKEKVAGLVQKLVQETERGKEGRLEARTAKPLVEKWAQKLGAGRAEKWGSGSAVEWAVTKEFEWAVRRGSEWARLKGVGWWGSMSEAGLAIP